VYVPSKYTIAYVLFFVKTPRILDYDGRLEEIVKTRKQLKGKTTIERKRINCIIIEAGVGLFLNKFAIQWEFFI